MARSFLLAVALALPSGALAQALPPWASTPAGAPAQTSGAAVPPPPPPAVNPALTPAAALARLDATLTWYEDNARGSRLAVSVTGGVLGAAALGLGLGLLTRDGRYEQTYGLAIGAGGLGMLLGVGIGLLLPDPMAPIRGPYREGVARGDAPERVLAATEAAWRERATSSQRARRVAGPLVIGLGGLSMAAGAWMALASRSSSSGNLTRALGTTLTATGALLGVTGAALMFAPDPVENGWAVYERSRVPVELGVAPVPGGAMAAVGGAF